MSTELPEDILAILQRDDCLHEEFLVVRGYLHSVPNVTQLMQEPRFKHWLTIHRQRICDWNDLDPRSPRYDARVAAIYAQEDPERVKAYLKSVQEKGLLSCPISE